MTPEAPGRPTRRRARDIRNGREGEVMANADEWQKGARGKYWLRPVGGGEEWPVPREYVQLLDDDLDPR